MGKRSNGEGTIYKRKDGRWCAAYYDDNFSRHYVYGKTQADVKKKLKELKGKRTVIKGDHQYTFQEWLLEYMTVYKKNDLKATTYSSYMYCLSGHIVDTKLGKMKLEDVRTEHLQKFYNNKIEDGYNSKTVHTIGVIINGGLEMAVKRRMIPENPNLYTTIPKKVKYEAEILSQEDVNKIIEEAQEEEMYPVIITTVYTGMRKAEVMGLRWENIDFEQRKIHVKESWCRVYSEETDEKGHHHTSFQLMSPKTKSSIRTIPMLDEVYNALLEQKRRQDVDKVTYGDMYDDQDFVFVGHDGRHIEEKRFLKMYYDFLSKYGLPVLRFHDLRHTFASLLIEADTSMKIIQELLGHSTITTSMDIYGHVSDEKKEQAMESFQNRNKKNS